MNLSDIVDQRFEENLALAREECEDNFIGEKAIWNIATEWTIEDMHGEIARHIDNKWAEKQEAINKFHYREES